MESSRDCQNRRVSCTVRTTLKRWEKQGLGGLWEAKGRGAKRKWQESDLEYVISCIEP